MIPHPLSATLFPYTTLFRSAGLGGEQGAPPTAFATPSRPLGLRAGIDLTRAVSAARSEEHTSELQSRRDLVCRLLLEKKNASPSPRCPHPEAEFKSCTGPTT